MEELLPGIYHWEATHPDIETDVHSYYVSALDPACLIDPLEPREGLAWFRQRKIPIHIYLTNRLHDRHSQRFLKAFSGTVWCHEAGVHELENGGLTVTSFRFGEQLPGGIRALKVGVLCPEESALLLPTAGGVLSIGDAIITEEGELGFVPDELLGNNPAAVKRGLKAAFLKICKEEAFDHVLFAHGDPLIGGGKGVLEAFCRD